MSEPNENAAEDVPEPEASNQEDVNEKAAENQEENAENQEEKAAEPENEASKQASINEKVAASKEENVSAENASKQASINEKVAASKEENVSAQNASKQGSVSKKATASEEAAAAEQEEAESPKKADNVILQVSSPPKEATKEEEKQDMANKPKPKKKEEAKEDFMTPVKYTANTLSYDITKGEIPLIGSLSGRTRLYFCKNDEDDYIGAKSKGASILCGFVFVPIVKKYKIVLIESSNYVGIKKIIKDEIEYKSLAVYAPKEVNNDTKQYLSFELNATQLNNKDIFFKWNDLYLTIKEDGFLFFEKKHDDDKLSDQLFTIKPFIDKKDEAELKILENLGLSKEKQDKYIGAKIDDLELKQVTKEAIELITKIFTRFDPEKTGYARCGEVLAEIDKYSDDIIPNIIFAKLYDKLPTESEDRKLWLHERKLIATMDSIWDFFYDEIEEEKEEKEAESIEQNTQPIEVKLRRLDDDILDEHPEIVRWRDSTPWERLLIDWNLKFKSCLKPSKKNRGVGLWTSDLLYIQSNFGESIYAYFEFARWIFILNFIMTLIYMSVLLPKAVNMYWSPALFTEENEDSFVYYGSYVDSYPFILTYSIGWAMVSSTIVSFGIWVASILKKILSNELDKENEGEFAFSSKVFAGYDFKITRKDEITLHSNSLMIRLHETLLAKLDEIINVLDWKTVILRFIGILLSISVAVVSSVAIVALIYYENTLIVDFAEKNFGAFADVFTPFIVPAGIAVLKAMTPTVMRKIIAFEKYSAAYEFQQTFFRIFLLRMFAILVTLFQTAQTAQNDEKNVTTQGNTTVSFQCAETQIGSVLLNLIVFDLILELFKFNIIPATKYYIGVCKGTIEKDQDEDAKLAALELKRQSSPTNSGQFELAGDDWKADFDIPKAIVDTVYRQVIVWSCLSYSPVVAMIAMGSTAISFYSKKRYLCFYCARPKKALGVVKQLKFFYGTMLFALLVSIIPFAFFVNREPSCGPHNKNVYEGNVLKQYERAMEDILPAFVTTILSYVLNYVIILPALIASWLYLIHVSQTKNKFIKKSETLKQSLDQQIKEKKQILLDYKIRL